MGFLAILEVFLSFPLLMCSQGLPLTLLGPINKIPKINGAQHLMDGGWQEISSLRIRTFIITAADRAEVLGPFSLATTQKIGVRNHLQMIFTRRQDQSF